jgi:hypothetical protein
MFAKFGRLFALVLLIFLSIGAGGAGAQVQPPEPKAAEHTTADIITWVKRDGQEAIFSHGAARIFGWGEGDVMVLRMAFANPENQNSFAFDVVRDKPNTVMTWRSPAEMVVWQMSDSGELLKTLHVDKAGVTPVDNALYLPKWRETLGVFFELIPAPAATKP